MRKQIYKIRYECTTWRRQGSIRGSYLVTMEWNGLKNNLNHVAICW